MVGIQHPWYLSQAHTHVYQGINMYKLYTTKTKWSVSNIHDICPKLMPMYTKG